MPLPAIIALSFLGVLALGNLLLMLESVISSFLDWREEVQREREGQ